MHIVEPSVGQHERRDDDMRIILRSDMVLEEHNMVITFAEDGRSAVRTLSERADVDVTLMDIMLPEMDGPDTIREIRTIPRLRDIPINAVTAKAMKGDHEKCLDAGAWDYVAKPVDVALLLSVLRLWLRK